MNKIIHNLMITLTAWKLLFEKLKVLYLEKLPSKDHQSRNNSKKIQCHSSARIETRIKQRGLI